MSAEVTLLMLRTRRIEPLEFQRISSAWIRFYRGSVPNPYTFARHNDDGVTERAMIFRNSVVRFPFIFNRMANPLAIKAQ
jgi:hypothetical protein